jgi:predicted amidophosphoribosyltransferase
MPQRCARCSAPVGPFLDTSSGCVHCRGDRFAFERVFSLGVYDAQLRSAVLAAKQQGGEVLTAALAELLARREADELQSLKIDLIVPIPHHWTERLLRRHLPPVTMATRLSRLLMATWTPHILAKVRRTRPQSQLEPTDRRNNLRGAFRLIGRARLDGTRVLLVDDVLTTIARGLGAGK